MSYFFATDFNNTVGNCFSNDDLKNSRHKSFFLKNVPNDLKTNIDYMARRNAEILLENIRRKNYNECASRITAIFLNKALGDAKDWIGKESRKDYSIQEVEPVDEIAASETNIIWYNYLVRLFKNPNAEFRKIFTDIIKKELNNVASAYWENTDTKKHGQTSKYEILFIGTLKIKKIYL